MLVEFVRIPDSVSQNIPGMSKKEEASESDVIILTYWIALNAEEKGLSVYRVMLLYFRGESGGIARRLQGKAKG